MSIQLNKLLDNNWNKIKNIKVTKLKNNIFKIKDGYLNFNLDITKKCMLCDKKKNSISFYKCYHFYAILIKTLKIDFYDDKYLFLFKNDNINNFINKKDLIIDEKDYECPICLESTKMCTFKKLYHCLHCGIFYHTKCLRKCEGNSCIICKNALN